MVSSMGNETSFYATNRASQPSFGKLVVFRLFYQSSRTHAWKTECVNPKVPKINLDKKYKEEETYLRLGKPRYPNALSI